MTATRPNFTRVSSPPYLLSTTLVEVQVDGSSRGRRRRDMSPTLIHMGNLRLEEALVLAVALVLADHRDYSKFSMAVEVVRLLAVHLNDHLERLNLL